ncbi:MAG: hypothetical protein ABIP41_05255 [Croceibacterium sp.]
MIRASRREALMGAIAVPALAGLPKWRWGSGTVLLHDPALAAGRRLAQSGRARGGDVLAIGGDPVRLAQAVFARGPALVVGISRPADALLIEDVAREAGYASVQADVAALREMIAASRPRDTGLVLGWVLAPGGRLPQS